METISAQAKQAADRGYQRLLATFAAVPDEKLAYRPADSCKSAIEIVAHVGFANQSIADALAGRAVPSYKSLEAMAEATKPMLATIKTRQQALDLLANSIISVHASLDAVTPEKLNQEVEMPFGKIPMHFVVLAPGMHMSSHAAQIDYIQTMWGDQQNHM